jgi:beta-galactosidase/beta-glucuronidase
MSANEGPGWLDENKGMFTRWAKYIDPNHILPEYPRPQMVRERWLNLNGPWNYAIKPLEVEKVNSYDGTIMVPFPVESILSGVKKRLLPEERLWYSRTFSLPAEWHGQRILLHFGAVDWMSEIWINGLRGGKHTGGFYPFYHDITDLLQRGQNEVTVAVWDPTDSYGQERGKQVLRPHTIFYTAVSGIWQTVWLEPVPESFIKSLKLLPDIDREELCLEIVLGGYPEKGLQLEAAVYESEHLVARQVKQKGEQITLKIPQPQLWSPDTPFLYDLELKLISKEHRYLDHIKSYFGMRKFSIARDERGVKRLFLNNKPLFQNGPLDQGYWPDGLYTAPTDEALRFDLEMTKKFGYNMTRKHIKVEPARWYYHCDQLGLIVWQDMINGGGKYSLFHHLLLPFIAPDRIIKDRSYKAMGRSDRANRKNFRKELKEMVDALFNVPSIGMWVIYNEGWGQFDTADNYNWLKMYDPSRYVDHASGWFDHGGGDMKSIHIYMRKLKIPQNINDRALIISEYGGYCLPVKGHMWKTGKGLGQVKFKEKSDYTRAFVQLVQEQLAPLIEKGLAGAVYTQLTDVEIETNGLITYDREVVKIESSQVRELNLELLKDHSYLPKR